MLTEAATPLQSMPNLAGSLSSPPLYVKRDDLTPLAMGGNKVRQLEFYLGDAVQRKADTILITGAVQSNFVRLAAAAARKLGMECHIQLEERVANNQQQYRQSGNVLLDRILGATMHGFAAGEDETGADNNLERIADELRDVGRNPYVIHLGQGHPSLGALGYVVAAEELVSQIEAGNLDVDRIVVASGSGATHAGLLFGLRLMNVDIMLTGVCVRRSAVAQMERIQTHCSSLAQLLAVDNPVRKDEILLEEKYLAPGYGKAGPEAEEAIRMAAQYEGLLVDPVYTAKSLACFIALARDGVARRPMIYVHTGGTSALFGYEQEVLRAISLPG